MNNEKSPWRKPSVNKKDKGGRYDPLKEEQLARGRTRRAIEDKHLQRELNDDPLFADREMIGDDADLGIEVGDK